MLTADDLREIQTFLSKDRTLINGFICEAALSYADVKSVAIRRRVQTITDIQTLLEEAGCPLDGRLGMYEVEAGVFDQGYIEYKAQCQGIRFMLLEFLALMLEDEHAAAQA